MNTKIILGAVPFFALVLAGCAGASGDDDTSGQSEGALVGGWAKMLTCTEGDSRVVVDVDSGERRHLQVVVSGGAAYYFASQYHVSTHSIINAKGEIIGDANINAGIFNPWDINDETVNIPNARMQVRREGDGVRVTIFTDQIDSWCDYETFGNECASGHGHETYRRDDIANWYFPSCE